jgi:gluconate 2-dehydrogenase gamma chain
MMRFETIHGSGEYHVLDFRPIGVARVGRRQANRKKKHMYVNRSESVSRRDLLVGLTATFASAIVPTSSLAFTQKSTLPEVLTNTERETLEAIVSRIIPADGNGPGALQSGCARYIESALVGAYQSLKNTYSEGLAALSSYAKSNGGVSFAALSPTEQDKVLSEFEQNTPVGSYRETAAFFELVRMHTLEGMFGDPAYGGNTNFAGWDLIRYPGPRMYVSPEMQRMDAKTPPSRVSVKRLMHDTH